uniref:DUF4939 domain-containing protein n=1 Tax=Cyprinus carpio carpio TaxID=630221 RepID=A0A9J7YZD5_CYPCA
MQYVFFLFVCLCVWLQRDTIPWCCLCHAGEPAGCGGFLKVLLYIEAQPQKFSIVRSKVALISLLSERALQWAKAIWDANSVMNNSYEPFTTHFKEVFGSSADEISTADQLLRLRQGEMTMNECTI